LPDRSATIKLVLDVKEFKSSLAEAKKALDKMRDVQVKLRVKADTTPVTAAVNAARKRIERPAEMRLRANTKVLESAIINARAKASSPINVPVKMTAVQAEAAKAAAVIRRTVSGPHRANVAVSLPVGQIMTFASTVLFATSAMRAMANTIRNTVGEALDFSAELQRTGVAFSTLAKDAQLAKLEVRQLMDLSQATPFGYESLAAAATRMHALGWEAQNVVRDLQAVTDAAAATGGMSSDVIDRITLALSQIKSKGSLQAQEMRQLAENGIAAWEFLARHLGKTIGEVQKMVEQRMISSEVALEAILGGMRENFAGFAVTMGNTYKGLQARISASWKETLAIVTRPVYSALEQDVFPGMLRTLQEFNATARATGSTLKALEAAVPSGLAESIDSASQAILLLKDGLDAVSTVLGPVTQGLTDLKGIADALTPSFGEGVRAIRTYIQSVKDGKTQSEALEAAVGKLMKKMSGVMQAGLDAASGTDSMSDGIIRLGEKADIASTGPLFRFLRMLTNIKNAMNGASEAKSAYELRMGELMDQSGLPRVFPYVPPNKTPKTPSGDGTGAGGKTGKAGKSATYEQLVSEIMSLEKLRLDAGRSSMDRYLAMLDQYASDVKLKEADRLKYQIEADRIRQDSANDLAEAVHKAEIQRQEDAKKAAEEARRLAEEEKAREWEIYRLRHELGLISLSEYLSFLQARVDAARKAGDEIKALEIQLQINNLKANEFAGTLQGQATAAVESADKAVSQLGLTLGTGLADAFTSAIINGQSFGDALKSLGLQIAATIVKAFMLKQILGSMGMLGGGVSVGSTAPLSGVMGVLHTGGLVGAEGAVRKLPRFHTGGVVDRAMGLSSDEVPAVLKKGEWVFTPEQMKAMGDALSQSRQTVVNHNYSVHISAVDGPSVARLLEGQAGTVEAIAAKAIRNGGALRNAVRGG
jgi:tape measure domain-containing protein